MILLAASWKESTQAVFAPFSWAFRVCRSLERKILAVVSVIRSNDRAGTERNIFLGRPEAD